MKARTLRLITSLQVTLLCFSTVYSQSYTPKYIIGAGEYNCFIIPTATHKLYDVAGGVPSLVPGQPSVVTGVAGALHHQCLLDDQGNVYCWGDNAYGEIGNGAIGGAVGTPTKVTVDSLGNPFNNIVQVCPGANGAGYMVLALKGDGTVWIWGATGTGNRGNGTMGGTTTRPVQIPFPAGVVIKKVQMDLFGMALDANGKVWTWGGNTGYMLPYLLSQANPVPDPTTPKVISIPSPVVDIQGGSTFNYALCANGDLYGWGYYAALIGLGATAQAPLTPTLLNATLGLTKPIKQISINNESSFVLLSDSTIWAWGDNACGTIGNGQEMNYATYVNSSGAAAPYAWDWGMQELLVPKPQQIAVGLHSFTNIWNALGDVFYTYAEDVNGNLYSWGRNKGGVLGNGQMDATGNILSIYPNSFDVPWVTAIDPFALTKPSVTSSPYCVLNPSGAPCNEYAIPAVANPVANAGPNQNITTSTTTLNGSATTANGNTFINYYLWTQVSGPSTALITLPSGPVAKVSNLVTGTYVFQLKATDNNWRTSTSKVTVVVNSSAKPSSKPIARPNSKITITLPVNTATLDGTASTDSGGVITSYAWQQNTGPNSATIAAPTSVTTGISGLVAGTYTFFLTVTDNLGATNTAADTVVVNSAPLPVTPPTVSAGSNQTIILPVSTATLTGTAAGTNGATIASTSWSQTGGPSTATIASVGSLVTLVTGLIQGTYTFSVSAVDNKGQTASATVTVIVNAVAATPPPTVSAGSTQTITLPANSATLTGTATGNGGATISSTQWTQTAGPAAATMGAAGSLSTSVSNLVQGTYTFTLTATDNQGKSSSSTVTITVNAAAATPPTVSAGSVQTVTLPTNSTTLTGTATGSNGATIASLSWTQTTGPAAATIGSPTGLSTSVSGLVQGTYIFMLTAIDNKGQTATSTVTVTVNSATALPPTVSAGSAQTITLPVNSVTLSGTATGSNGATISSTAWTQVSGPTTASIGAASSLATTASGLSQGVYVFLLTAKDNNSQTASASVTVTVNPAPVTPPTASAGTGQTITLPTNSVTLTGTAAGTGGATIVSTTWTQASGPAAATIAAPGTLSTSANNLQAGNYTFVLTVTDNNGQSASANVNVTVNPAPVPVTPPAVSVAAVAPITLPASSITLAGTASGTNGATITGVQWSEVSGPANATIGTPNTLTSSISGLTAAGTYTFQLTVTENNGQSASATITVTVNSPAANVPPVANPGGNQTFTLTGSDTTVTLNGSASYDPDGTIVSYDWYQLSGKGGVTIANSNTPTPTIHGLQPGVYVFVLVVTDNGGATTQAQITITINAAPVAPVSTLVANAGKDTAIALPASMVQLNGSASSVSGSTITAYQWTQVGGPEGMTLAAPNSAVTEASNLVAGLYIFRLKVTDQAGDTASATVKVTVMSNTRTSKDSTNEQFSLYPNPAHDQTTLTVTGDGQGLVMLALFDMNGKFIRAMQFNKMPGTSSTTIDVSHLTPGMYIIRASYGINRTVQIKLMKQ